MCSWNIIMSSCRYRLSLCAIMLLVTKSSMNSQCNIRNLSFFDSTFYLSQLNLFEILWSEMKSIVKSKQTTIGAQSTCRWPIKNGFSGVHYCPSCCWDQIFRLCQFLSTFYFILSRCSETLNPATCLANNERYSQNPVFIGSSVAFVAICEDIFVLWL